MWSRREAVVDGGLEDRDLLAGDLGAAQAADQLLRLAAVHAADDDLDPAGVRRKAGWVRSWRTDANQRGRRCQRRARRGRAARPGPAAPGVLDARLMPAPRLLSPPDGPAGSNGVDDEGGSPCRTWLWPWWWWSVRSRWPSPGRASGCGEAAMNVLHAVGAVVAIARWARAGGCSPTGGVAPVAGVVRERRAGCPASSGCQGRGRIAAVFDRLKRLVLGGPRDLRNPLTFHAISLVALLAWVGLGADGLSSSSYGPDEAFRALGSAHYLAIALALATAVTVVDHLGGLLADHRALPLRRRRLHRRLAAARPRWRRALRLGAAGGLRPHHRGLDRQRRRPGLQRAAARAGPATKLLVEAMRHRSAGGDEPARGQGVGHHAGADLRPVRPDPRDPHLRRHRRQHRPAGSGRRARGRQRRSASGLATLGLAWACSPCSCRAYSMGAGTYTGIEAVSNGLQIMREPKVHTARAHHDLHGGLAGRHRRRDPGLLPAVSRRAGAGQDHERGAGRALRRRRGTRAACRWDGSRRADAGGGGGAAVRRGADRIHRRPAGDGQHGDGLLGPAPLRAALEPAHHAERCPAHGRSPASACCTTRTATSPRC